jgi:hypothetical protein
VPQDAVRQVAVLADGSEILIAATTGKPAPDGDSATRSYFSEEADSQPESHIRLPAHNNITAETGGETGTAPASQPAKRLPLGTILGARSGDKGGDANLGVWARDDAAHAWLTETLTTAKLRELLPETAELPITRHELPKLRALNFVIEGLLGEGVASSTRFDPQAKALGEWLRARHADIPEVLL